MQSLIAVHDNLQHFPAFEFSILLQQGKRLHWRCRRTGHQGFMVLQFQKKQRYAYNVQACKDLYRPAFGYHSLALVLLVLRVLQLCQLLYVNSITSIDRIRSAPHEYISWTL